MGRPRDTRDTRSRRPMQAREKPEYEQKVLDIRRTARVVAGGRRFSFRIAVVVGNRNGKVGVGLGKGTDVATAMEKAGFQAKKSVFTVPMTAKKSIPHEVKAKYGAAQVILKPAQEGKGLMAGGPIRIIADLAGIKNLTAKILGRTPNKLNNARATVVALKQLKAQKDKPKEIVPAGENEKEQ